MNHLYNSLYSAIYPRLPIFAQNWVCTTGGLLRFRSRLGDEIRIRIELVNSIDREPNGKFRAVKSEVGRNAP